MTEKMKITLDNGISGITLGDCSCNFRLLAYSGFAAADIDVQVSVSGASDGGYISTSRFGTRTLEIKFDFGENGAESVRQSLISFFAPSRITKISVQRGNVKREIEGRVSDFDIVEKNRFSFSAVNVSILCPDPYFKSVDTVYLGSARSTPMFHLPCHFPCVIGTQSSTGYVEIMNNGDTYADMIAELVAASAVTAPYVLNRTNGKQIRLLNEISPGQIVVISTVRRAKTATVNGKRGLIDPTSVFSDFLEPGLNQIEYGSDDGSDMISASIKYTALYLGV